MAAALLVLTFAGPVAADPTVRQLRLTDVYHTTCPGGIVFDQFAYGVPGWDVDWAPGDTPWLLMGYNVTIDDVVVRVVPVKGAGLVRIDKLVGPCTLTVDGFDGALTDAYFLKR